jgi:Ca2+-binding RTX toxin-like protein
VSNWFGSHSNQLTEIRFADGTAWTKEKVGLMRPLREGTDAGETINGSQGNDEIRGYGGNDVINSGKGNDFIIGGEGNDTLNGGAGDDIYAWNLGDGNDVIFDDAGVNALQFGEGINAADIKFTRGGSGNYDAIFIIPGGEKITVRNWFAGSSAQLSEIRFADGTVWNKDDVNNMSPLYEGTANDDTITGSSGNDTIYGYEGTDTLRGGDGNDALNGGTGNDALEGGTGNDTYVWNLGDGSDTINDLSGNNVLSFGEGIIPGNVKFTRGGNGYRDAIFKMSDGGTVTVLNWFSNANNQLSEVRFADGTVWSKDDINGMNALFEGTAGDDNIGGSPGNDAIFGYDGNDTLKGGAGDDTLNGGAGDDRLEGGNGNDTYVWNLGDGNDTINDYLKNRANYNKTGILKFGGSITADDIELSVSSNNAVFIIKETGERVTVQNWYLGYDYQLTEVEFADGTKWSNAEINAMNPITWGTDGDDTINNTGNASDAIYAGDGNDTINGGSGDDIIYAGNGNDTVNGGSDNDTIYGEGGNDSLDGGYGNDTIYAGDGNDTVNGGSGNDTIYGGEGNDSLDGGYDNDTIFGGTGDDTLTGGAGDDILIGGAGNDTLIGDHGNDVYIWNLGDGNDIIGECYGDGILKFGEGITADDLELTAVGNNTVFIIKETGERITVQNWYQGYGYQLTKVEFADGTEWTNAEINAMSPVVHGTTGNDTINAGNANDIIYAGNGNDIIYAGNGNDTIYAGAGNDTVNAGDDDDTIYGEDGNDSLNGGAGNDTLIGGVGDDTLTGDLGHDVYIWNLGDGNDIINDYRFSKANYDETGILKFGEGITADDIELSAIDNDAIFIVKETGERITVQNWYQGYDYQLTKIEFMDGTEWTNSEMNAMSPIIRGGNDNDTISAGNANDTIYGGGGNDILTGNTGNDILCGDDGDDRLIGGIGDDILTGGTGDDYLEGGYGNDTYIWNPGDGNDVVNDHA